VFKASLEDREEKLFLLQKVLMIVTAVRQKVDAVMAVVKNISHIQD